MFNFQAFAQTVGQALDAVGVIAIIIGVLISTAVVIVSAVRRKAFHSLYKTYRQNLSRSILIGLEFLVAGDIIRSVAGDLSLNSVIVLAIIVLIRLVMGANLEMEIEGRWPWQRNKK